MSWFEERFTPTSGRLLYPCCFCARPMFFPPSKHGKYKTCGDECAKGLRQQVREQRSRPCETCGEIFTPRPGQLAVGHGRYCSQKCNTKSHAAMNEPDAQARSKASWAKAYEAGQVNVLRGADSPKWKGGYKLRIQKLIEDGTLARRTREYRARYPHKAREFSRRRGERMIERLPRGTIPAIGARQRWMCSACGKNTKHKYHVDHIVPLALGGEHKPANLQILCPRCNLRKSAKDPVQFMQEMGFLL